MKHCLLLISLIQIIPTCTLAQSYIDIISLGYHHEFQTSLDGTDEKVNVNDYLLNVNLPIPLSDNDVLLVSALNHRLSLNFNDSPLENETLWGVRFGLGYRKQWNEQWYSVVQFLGGTAGAFEEENDLSFLGGGLAIIGYQAKEHLQYRWGLYGTKEFFGPFFVPILGLDWQINERLRLFGNLPINATLVREYSDNFWAGIGFLGIVTSYKVTLDGAPFYWEQVSNQAFVFGDFFLRSNIVLQARVGYIIGRRFWFYRTNDQVDARISAIRFGDNRTSLLPPFRDTPFAEVRLIFRIDLRDQP